MINIFGQKHAVQRFGRPMFSMACSAERRDQILVSSHERSGTHFLINSITMNTDYRNDPVVDFDIFPVGSFVNFTQPASVADFFNTLNEKNCASVVKSHFSADFFLDFDGKYILPENVRTVYIVRNPVDTLSSFTTGS